MIGNESSIHANHTHVNKIYVALLLCSSIYVITDTTTYVKVMATPFLVEMI